MAQFKKARLHQSHVELIGELDKTLDELGSAIHLVQSTIEKIKKSKLSEEEPES